MIQPLWTIPCRVSITDRGSNNVSLIEVIEEVTVVDWLAAGGRPDLIPAFLEVVTLWTRDDISVPATGWGKLAFISPTNEEITAITFEVDLRTTQRARTAGKFVGIPIRAPGLHHFVVSRKEREEDVWQEAARIPLVVNIERPEPPAAKAGEAAER
jgi:hypothetical protein